ncbi:VanZ family protein [Polaribacter sp.]|uniref:VanZ family protein n=1 Tax=Polaribacter sp. TaxID=1920175 RepID=UPI003F4AB910
MKVPKFPATFNGIDKWEHSFAYFTLSICWLFAFYKNPKIKYYIVFACIVYGIILEGLQGTLTNYRTADYLDAIANSIGVLLGLTVFNQILKKNRVK